MRADADEHGGVIAADESGDIGNHVNLRANGACQSKLPGFYLQRSSDHRGKWRKPESPDLEAGKDVVHGRVTRYHDINDLLGRQVVGIAHLLYVQIDAFGLK